MCHLHSCYYVFCKDIWIPSYVTNCAKMNFPVPWLLWAALAPAAGEGGRHANPTACAWERNESSSSTVFIAV